jgi:hypothetical protein
VSPDACAPVNAHKVNIKLRIIFFMVMYSVNLSEA